MSPLGNVTNASVAPTTNTETLNQLNEKIVGRVSAVAPQGKRKKNKESEEVPPIPDEEKSYYELGRLFARISDPFADIPHVVAVGIKFDTADPNEESDHEIEVSGDSENIHLLETWKIWTDKYPCFRHDVLAAQDNPSSISIIKKINSKVMEGMNAIRGVDTSGLKDAILKYLLEDPNASLEPPITKKSERGWSHPVTARLLCPLAWDATESTYKAIIEGRKTLTADYYPRFLYPDNRTYNCDDLETGLLQSKILFRVAKHIFMGPSAALEAPGYHRGKRSNAQIIGIVSMTPATIAYIAVQVRNALATHSWSTVDVSFDYSAFYWNIVGVFDAGEGQQILDVFNYQVFGPRNDPAEDEEIVSDLVRIKEERARKRTRLNSGGTTLPGEEV